MSFGRRRSLFIRIIGMNKKNFSGQELILYSIVGFEQNKVEDHLRERSFHECKRVLGSPILRTMF